MIATTFDLQGHRGARGLKPENTLPSFEAALDLLVSSLETDLHLSKDDVPVLHHDAVISQKIASLVEPAKAPDPVKRLKVRELTLAQLRCYVLNGNPDPQRFPKQNKEATPAAKAFAEKQGFSVYAAPALADLFGFVEAYAGDLGKQAGKTDLQRDRARQVRFNLELKRVPFRPEYFGDGFDGDQPATLERQVVEEIRKANVSERTIIQSFDHRTVPAIRKLEPKIVGAVLIANTAPFSVTDLVKTATAQIYSPDFEFLDIRQIRQAHEAKIKVIPYTVNEVQGMTRLLDWGVDGLITDFPDRLIPLLQTRHIRF